MDVCFTDGRSIPTPSIAVVGPQSQLNGTLRLYGQIDSFGVFFQPAGFSQLFGLPMSEFINRNYEGTSVLGSHIRSLWNELGESSVFAYRVSIVEQFLLKMAMRAAPLDPITASANEFLTL